MKGVVFTELLAMVEDRYGLEMVDRIIQAATLPSEGVYTAVGTYDFTELLSLVEQLSQQTATPVPKVVQDFGRYLFPRFTQAYPGLFANLTSSAELLRSVEGVIHVEVKKLYPDAELPSIVFQPTSDGRWQLDYRSSRPLADLCQGLIEACAEHYDEELVLQRIEEGNQDGSAARFIIQLLPRKA